jgi:hypothetical protein
MKAKMQIASLILAVGLPLAVEGPAPAQGATFYVSPQGSDSAAGTITAPFRTVNFAVTRLSPGDTLNLRGGTYFQRVTVSISGTAGAPIVIQGFPGETGVLDSGPPEFRTVGNSDWELVNATTGEYRSVRTFSSGTVYGYVAGIPGYENERVVLVPYVSASAFRATTDAYVNSSTPFYVGPGAYYDSGDSRIHIRLAKTTDLRATEARYGTVFATENADPRNYAIFVSQASATLTVSGAYLTFKDLTVHQAVTTIQMSSSANNIRFDGITAWLGDSTIEASGSGIHHITLTNSRLYGDAPYWIFWSDMKDPPAPADLLRGTAIDLRSGTHDWEISYNHFRGSGQDLLGVNNDEYNIIVHHNRMENCGDDAFELEGTTDVGRIAIYENYIANCLVAIAPGQDTATFTGPLLVYRNVIALLRNPPINRKEGINTWNGGGRFGYEYMFKQSGSSYATANAHYYHNTLIMLNSAGKGINITPQNPQNTRIANNLMIMVNGAINGSYLTGSGQVVNGDLYWKVNTVDSARLLSSYDTVAAFSAATGLEANGIGSVPKRGTDPQFATLRLGILDQTRSIWELLPTSEVFKPSDFFLGAGSPAIGAGIVIPAHPTLGQLPDTRTSRDIGAFPYGTSAAEYDIFPYVPNGPVTPPDGVAPAAPTNLGTR